MAVEVGDDVGLDEREQAAVEAAAGLDRAAGLDALEVRAGAALVEERLHRLGGRATSCPSSLHAPTVASSGTSSGPPYWRRKSP